MRGHIVTHPLLLLQKGDLLCVCVCDEDNYAYGVNEREKPSWLSCHPRLVHFFVNRNDKHRDNWLILTSSSSQVLAVPTHVKITPVVHSWALPTPPPFPHVWKQSICVTALLSVFTKPHMHKIKFFLVHPNFGYCLSNVLWATNTTPQKQTLTYRSEGRWTNNGHKCTMRDGWWMDKKHFFIGLQFIT